MANLANYGNARVLSNVTDIDGGTPNTGEMRRKYNFADKFTELSIDQTPFFRLVAKIGKKPTDDPQFKFTEKRQSWMKRYAYCVGAGTVDTEVVTADQLSGTNLDGNLDKADVYLYMATDYKSHGNIQNIIGQAGADIGDAGTRPEFYLPNQVIKVNYGTTNDGSFSDFALYKITGTTAGFLFNAVDTGELNGQDETDSVAGGFLAGTTIGSGYATSSYYEVMKLDVQIVKEPSQDAAHLTSFVSGAFQADASPNSAYDKTIAEHLELRMLRTAILDC